MVTRSGWLVVAGSVAAVVAGRILALGELPILGAIGLATVVLAILSVRLRPATVRVERHLRPGRVPVGGRCRVDLEIGNAGHRATPVLELHDPVEGTVGASMALGPIDPGQRTAAGYRMPTEARGLVHAGPLVLVQRDPFGLAQRASIVADEVALVVLPAIDLLQSSLGGSGLDDPLAGAARSGLSVAGIENFASLRPYVVGDDLRRVHWASSARTGDLVVREDDPPWRGHLTVVLDAREHVLDAASFEIAVSAAASILYAVARRGDRCRLLVTDGTDSGLGSDRGTADVLLDRLAVVERHGGGALPDAPIDGRTRTGGLVLVTGAAASDEVVRFFAPRDRFGWARVVQVDPSAVGGAPGPPLAVPPRVADLVRVEAGRPFAFGWAEADRLAGVRS